MRTEDWVLSEGISFKSRDCSERAVRAKEELKSIPRIKRY